MTFNGTNNLRLGRSWIRILLFAFVVSLLSAPPAWADDCVGDYGGVVDGFVNPIVPPSQLNNDGSYTIRNYTASNTFDTNISLYTSPGQNNQHRLLLFDNLIHTCK